MTNTNTALKYTNNILTHGNLGCDDYTMKFYDSDSLISELNRREQNTFRVTVDTKAIEFLTIDQLLSHGYQLKMTAQQDAIDESRVFAKVNDMIYPISLNSFVSIKSRIDIYGKGLLDLSDKTLKLVLNELISQIDKVMIVIIDNKIRAIFSAANGGYKPIPANELLKTTLDTLGERVKNIKFEVACMDYDYMYVKMLFPDEKETLQNLYNKDEDYIPGIMIKTSDTGFSANEINPIWKIGSTTVVFEQPHESVRMIHRGQNANIDTIKDDVPNIFVKLRDTIKLIKKQMQYKVKYPQLTLDNACYKLKLGKKDTRYIQDKFNLFLFMNPDKEITGYDLTKLFVEMANEIKDEGKQAVLESIAGKAFNLNYEKLDKELN
ncbi:hypothetical protein [Alkaliphilus sp. B6464]|uniref:hypothetical protein n=1 Tax=Alkaliphilus sp. B6464 TaxID=2731219 RepID=UPI001BA49CE9|nr:hypothetical protein [Alkaliphilus sp. B6464]QUH21899.1 hypothetical protein HYG84_18355 [Alkaliphilus sp. B6464]